MTFRIGTHSNCPMRTHADTYPTSVTSFSLVENRQRVSSPADSFAKLSQAFLWAEFHAITAPVAPLIVDNYLCPRHALPPKYDDSPGTDPVDNPRLLPTERATVRLPPGLCSPVFRAFLKIANDTLIPECDQPSLWWPGLLLGIPIDFT